MTTSTYIFLLGNFSNAVSTGKYDGERILRQFNMTTHVNRMSLPVSLVSFGFFITFSSMAAWYLFLSQSIRYSKDYLPPCLQVRGGGVVAETVTEEKLECTTKLAHFCILRHGDDILYGKIWKLGCTNKRRKAVTHLCFKPTAVMSQFKGAINRIAKVSASHDIKKEQYKNFKNMSCMYLILMVFTAFFKWGLSYTQFENSSGDLFSLDFSILLLLSEVNNE